VPISLRSVPAGGAEARGRADHHLGGVDDEPDPQIRLGGGQRRIEPGRALQPRRARRGEEQDERR
jgi:hypothetical protein